MTRAVVFAYHNVGVRCLKVLLAGGVDVPLVVTHADDPGETQWFGSVAATAADYGIPAIVPPDPNAADVIARVAALAPDFLFSFYYRRLLGHRCSPFRHRARSTCTVRCCRNSAGALR